MQQKRNDRTAARWSSRRRLGNDATGWRVSRSIVRACIMGSTLALMACAQIQTAADYTKLKYTEAVVALTPSAPTLRDILLGRPAAPQPTTSPAQAAPPPPEGDAAPSPQPVAAPLPQPVTTPPTTAEATTEPAPEPLPLPPPPPPAVAAVQPRVVAPAPVPPPPATLRLGVAAQDGDSVSAATPALVLLATRTPSSTAIDLTVRVQVAALPSNQELGQRPRLAASRAGRRRSAGSGCHSRTADRR